MFEIRNVCHVDLIHRIVSINCIFNIRLSRVEEFRIIYFWIDFNNVIVFIVIYFVFIQNNDNNRKEIFLTFDVKNLSIIVFIKTWIHLCIIFFFKKALFLFKHHTHIQIRIDEFYERIFLTQDRIRWIEVIAADLMRMMLEKQMDKLQADILLCYEMKKGHTNIGLEILSSTAINSDCVYEFLFVETCQDSPPLMIFSTGKNVLKSYYSKK